MSPARSNRAIRVPALGFYRGHFLVLKPLFYGYCDFLNQGFLARSVSGRQVVHARILVRGVYEPSELGVPENRADILANERGFPTEARHSLQRGSS